MAVLHMHNDMQYNHYLSLSVALLLTTNYIRQVNVVNGGGYIVML